MKDFRVRFDCRLCGGTLTEVLDLGETPLANELPARQDAEQDVFPLYLSRCTICGHVQLPVVVNPERLFRDYVYRSSTSPVMRKHLEDFARDVQPKAGGFVVEIGSNDGTLLHEYQKLGFSVLGVDPAHNMADLAEALRVPTIRAFFGKATLSNWNLAGRKADLIVALNVFAHADDLADIADGVAALLAPGGMFVFEVGYLPTMLKKEIFRTLYHEHLSYHHLRPLQSFLRAHGLRMYDAELVPTQGGSVRVYAALRDPDAYDPVSLRLAKLLAAETPEATDAALLREPIARDRARLRSKLDAARAEGKTVCGYGCPAQLTTTAYALGLRREDIAFVVDNSETKQGKYTPGLHWPIVPTSFLVDKAPDVCVIFSANFADDIRARHKDFTGEWVVP